MIAEIACLLDSTQFELPPVAHRHQLLTAQPVDSFPGQLTKLPLRTRHNHSGGASNGGLLSCSICSKATAQKLLWHSLSRQWCSLQMQRQEERQHEDASRRANLLARSSVQVNCPSEQNGIHLVMYQFVGAHDCLKGLHPLCHF